jgi:hypothetical protein
MTWSQTYNQATAAGQQGMVSTMGAAAFPQYESTGMAAGTTDSASQMAMMTSGYMPGGAFAGLTGMGAAQALSTAVTNMTGVTGDPGGIQAAYLKGGTWGAQDAYQNASYKNQMGQIGVGYARAAQEMNYLWGAASGGTAQDPSANSSWGLQNQQIAVQWAGTQAQEAFSVKSQNVNYAYSQQSLANQYQQFQTNTAQTQWQMGFGYQTNLIQRGQERESYQYQMETNQMQFGWGIQDIDEQIRRSSGYERSLLVRQRGREVTSENLQVGQMKTVQGTQETLFKREDEEYNKQVQQFTTITALQNKQFEAEKQHTTEMYELNSKELQRQIQETQDLHDIQMKQIELDRDNQQKSIQFQLQSLGLQAEQAKLAQNFQGVNEANGRVQSAVAGAFQIMANNANAIIAAMNSILQIGGLHMQAKSVKFANGSQTVTLDGGFNPVPGASYVAVGGSKNGAASTIQ